MTGSGGSGSRARGGGGVLGDPYHMGGGGVATRNTGPYICICVFFAFEVVLSFFVFAGGDVNPGLLQPLVVFDWGPPFLEGILKTCLGGITLPCV